MSLMMGQQANVRPDMQQVLARTESVIIQSLRTMAEKDQLVAVGVNYLSQKGNVQIRGFVEGVINYFDYLVNFKGMQQDPAFAAALEEYAQAYSGKVLSQMPDARNYDQNLQMAIQHYAATFDQIVSEINRVIVPYIRPAGLGQGTGGLLGGINNAARRQSGGGFLNNAVNTNSTLGGQGVFGAAAPSPVGAGGVDLFAGNTPPAQPATTSNPTPTVQNVLTEPSEPVCPKTAKDQLIQRRLLKLMNYQDHKTYAFLKPTLASSVTKPPMDEAALDNSLSSLNELAYYTTLRDSAGVLRNDITPKRNAGYNVGIVSLGYKDQVDLTSIIEEEPSLAFKITGSDLTDYSYGGVIHQWFPKAVHDEQLTNLLDTYSTGIMTHNRFVEFLSKLEDIFTPEVCKVINDKVTSVANSFWRYYLNQLAGGIDNYLTSHQSVSQYLKLNQPNTQLLDVWDSFPRFFMRSMFNLSPIEVPEGEPKAESFFLTAAFVRLPYASWHLALGVKDDSDLNYAIVAKESTPGLYHVCSGLQQNGDLALHRLIITTDGRMLEVIRPLVGESKYFILTELPALL